MNFPWNIFMGFSWSEFQVRRGHEKSMNPRSWVFNGLDSNTTWTMKIPWILNHGIFMVFIEDLRGSWKTHESLVFHKSRKRTQFMVFSWYFHGIFTTPWKFNRKYHENAMKNAMKMSWKNNGIFMALQSYSEIELTTEWVSGRVSEWQNRPLTIRHPSDDIKMNAW